jgi:hypothetical protein
MSGIVVGYDAIRPKNIPDNAEAVFPYADGQYAWLHDRFPSALYRYITVKGDVGVDIADFEPGCMWPVDRVAQWAHDRIDAGKDVTVYTDRDNFPIVRDGLAGINWHLFLSVGTDPILKSYRGMPVRACQRFGLGFDIDTVFEPEWLNKP